MLMKQRIIGTVVLVSLGIIAIPILLEKPHQSAEPEKITIDIPPPPQVPSFVIEPAEPPSELAGLLESPAAPDPDEEIIAEPDKTPSTPSDPVALAADPVEVLPETARSTAVAEESDAAPDLGVDAQGQPVGWVVRIGSFRNRANALRIRDDLLADKTGSFTEEVRDANGEALVRVFAGPFLNREEAEAARVRLNEIYRVNAVVTRFQASG